MATFNQCQLIGRLGKDPVLEVTPNGKPHTKFSLVVDQGKDQPTMWLNVTCWDKLAETVEKYAVRECWCLSRANFSYVRTRISSTLTGYRLRSSRRLCSFLRSGKKTMEVSPMTYCRRSSAISTL